MQKSSETILITNDGLGVIEAMEAVIKAMKDISPEFSEENGILTWDVSKNAPGYSVKLVDEGVGKAQKIVVGKAKRVRKAPTLAFMD